jgi:hypothetical protein
MSDALRQLHDAANVLAESGLRTVKTNDLCIAVYGAIDEITRLREALEKIAALDVPRPVMTRYRTDGIPSKYDRCAHLIPMWDDCARCISDYARAARAEKEEK